MALEVVSYFHPDSIFSFQDGASSVDIKVWVIEIAGLLDFQLLDSDRVKEDCGFLHESGCLVLAVFTGTASDNLFDGCSGCFVAP